MLSWYIYCFQLLRSGEPDCVRVLVPVTSIHADYGSAEHPINALPVSPHSLSEVASVNASIFGAGDLSNGRSHVAASLHGLSHPSTSRYWPVSMRASTSQAHLEKMKQEYARAKRRYIRKRPFYLWIYLLAHMLPSHFRCKNMLLVGFSFLALDAISPIESVAPKPIPFYFLV